MMKTKMKYVISYTIWAIILCIGIFSFEHKQLFDFCGMMFILAILIPPAVLTSEM